MNIETHNGIFTVQSPSGEHRTFRVKTQAADATFAPGERILSILSGSDNNHDYTGFAFIKADGRIILWKKFRGNGTPSMHERYVRVLLHPDHYRGQGMSFHMEGRCRRCNRRLTTPESISVGIGPTCRGK